MTPTAEEYRCPRCGLALPIGSTYCPECGKDFKGQILSQQSSQLQKADHRRMNLATAIMAPTALVFGVATFQLGYSSFFLAFIVPALAFALVYVWERNRGLQPGWEFIALSAVGTYAGAIFGFVWVLVPVLIYFLVMRYLLNRKEIRRSQLRARASST